MSNHSFWSPTAKVNGWQPTSKPELYHHGVKGMKWGVRKERQATGTDAVVGGGFTDIDPEELARYQAYRERWGEDITFDEFRRMEAQNDKWFNAKMDEAAKSITPGKAYKYAVVDPLEYELENRWNKEVQKSIGDDREGSIQGRDWYYESAIDGRAQGGKSGPARSGPADDYEENFIREKRVKDTGKKAVDTTNSALDKKHNAEKKLVTNTTKTVKDTTKKRKDARTGLGRLIKR